MLDHQAAVHHDRQASRLRTSSTVLVDALELGPDGARTGGDDVVEHSRQKLASPEHVHEVDRCRDVPDAAKDPLPQNALLPGLTGTMS